MERLRTTPLGLEEERAAWEGLAAACMPPVKRLGAFLLVGFVAFVVIVSATMLLYNIFGVRHTEEQLFVAVPTWTFYAAMALSLALALAGYAIWLVRGLRTYAAFAKLLRGGGLDPLRPTAGGLRAYPDDQLLALRSRYERLHDGDLKERFERTFGFHSGDSFSLAPLSVLPGTFEMNALRVDWESNLIVRSEEPMPEVSWWTEARLGLLPRQPHETRRLVNALRYTSDSVRELKRRYGYRTDRWPATVPEGQLFDALRDLEEARRIRNVLSSKPRNI